SAIFTGLLLAFFLPPTCPLWIAFAGAVFSILVAKIPFGGTGSSIFNVSLVGWAFIVLSFPQEMLNYKSILTDKTEVERKISDFDLPAHNVRRLGKILEISGVDSVSALPPQEVKERYIDFRENFFLGWKGGTLGDCAGILFLVGFLIMFYKRYFGWRAPFSFLSVLFFLSWLFTGEKGIASGHPTFYLFSGSTLVLAFYSCLDWPTTPITKKGRFYFGFFAGSLVFLTRTYGIFTEVGGFAILLVNCISPLLDKKGSVNPQFLKQFR
ncbi:RnfABCDGE type electron transport complex subunit D, partial [bacterium]|nr:RnfABCDGE type electron transport complex subunit D [bacterium]